MLKYWSKKLLSYIFVTTYTGLVREVISCINEYGMACSIYSIYNDASMYISKLFTILNIMLGRVLQL